MPTRMKQPGARGIDPDIRETPDTPLPLLASTIFCDDLRLEASGKFCMIGCYPGNLIVANPLLPVTQRWVLTRLIWRDDFDASGLRMRVDLPAQGPSYMDVKPNPRVNEALARDATCVWQLRLQPLRIGDLLRVSMEKGSARLPCGELLVVQATPPTRH